MNNLSYLNLLTKLSRLAVGFLKEGTFQAHVFTEQLLDRDGLKIRVLIRNKDKALLRHG